MNASTPYTKIHHQTKFWAGIIGIGIVAFIFIAIISATIFKNIPHSEDEAAYLFQARVFALNRLSVPTPPLPDAFWSPFVVDYHGQRFGKYQIGWPLLLSLGVRLNAPWFINALLGSLTLGCIAWLGNQFYCDNISVCYTSILAAGLGLFTPAFLLLSSSLLSHTASLFWITLSLVTLFQMTKPKSSSRWQRPAYAMLTGAFLGGAFITRPFAALSIGLTIAIFLLILIARSEIKWTSLVCILVGGLPIAGLMPFFWEAVTGNPGFNAYLLVWPYDRIGFGPDVGPHGYTLHNAIFINSRLKLVTLATGLFGWPGWSSLLFLPVPFLTGRANRWDWLLLGTIVSIIFVHLFYWAFGGTDGGFPRYYYDVLPAFLLLTARGILILGQFLGQWRHSLRWIPLALVIIFTGYNILWNLPPLLVAQQTKYNITPAPLNLVEQANLPAPTLILVQDVNSWSDFAAPFSANSPTLDGPILYAIDWGGDFGHQLRERFSGRECRVLRNGELHSCLK